MDQKMFCYQCEQTARGTGCTTMGVCGKTPEAAALQDLIIHGLKGMAFWAHQARLQNLSDPDIDLHMIEALFTTITNVDFDVENLAKVAEKTVQMRDHARALFEKSGASPLGAIPLAAEQWALAENVEDMVEQGRQHPVIDPQLDPDIQSMRDTLLYGCKGVAVYADHAHILGNDNDEIYAFFHKALSALTDTTLNLTDYINLTMECGQINIKTAGLLNEAHCARYQPPVPTPVNIGTKEGKAILVSGHDLKMLEELLKQTEGKGINVYTHVEMLPAHGYPQLKKYPHLVGNFGGA